MTDLRAAVIGFGGVAQSHVQGYQQARGAELVAVVDSEAERLRPLEGSGVRTFADAGEMLSAVRPDIVSICTPPVSHAELAQLAFEHGAHVFCEKPLARNTEEGRRMVEASQKAGRLLGIAFCHRFIPAIRRLRELIASGALGRPLLYRNQFSGPLRGVEDRWFSNPEISGGGAMMDTTVHSVDLFRYLLGEVQEVRALCATSSDKLRVEDTSIMLVKAVNGCIGTLEASWMVAPGTLIIEVRGDAGEAFYDYEKLRWRGAEGGEFREELLSGGCDIRFTGEIQHFVDAVRGDVPLELHGNEGLRALELLEQAYHNSGH